jgi:peptide/nickel transport system permease protein
VTVVVEPPAPADDGVGPPTGRRTRSRRLGVAFWVSAAWVMLLVLLALFADLLPIRDPEAKGIITGEVARFEKPGWNAWFGGDGSGRDLFANVVHGARPALLIGTVVTLLAAVIGGAIGMLAGFRRGRTDGAIMTIADTAFAFPGIIALIAVQAAFGNGMLVFITVFVILAIPAYTRIVRGATLSLAEREFVDAARAMGASGRRIMVRELAPNVALPLLSFAFLGFAIVIALEGGLAFIGLSLDQTTWGKLIADGVAEIRNHPHLALIPATAMFLTILAFNFMGDSLRQRAAPRQAVTARKVKVVAEEPANRDGSRATPDGAVAPPDAVLRVDNLRTRFGTPDGVVEAVAGVSLHVSPGEALGIVGESGSGKSMILRSIVDTFPIPDVVRSGSVLLDEVDLLRIDAAERRSVLGTRIGTVFQNPLTALNPVRRIETQITEPMRVHGGLDRRAARRRALELLENVGIPAPEQRLREYPHQLSGGMRQRVTIAIALANQPEILLADEPTTALDVTVQDQIMRLIDRLRREEDLGVVLVTHDLAVVRGHTDRVAIVYAGQVVETGPTETLFQRPRHPYTVALLNSIPDVRRPSHSELAVIEGRPPSLVNPPVGCRFAPRCPSASDRCRNEAPTRQLNDDPDHSFACWHPEQHHDW